ncbi:tripartite tricarboxylate transporter permease [Pikeienuella sp. HZG-20]|uniref:tripartite tricarboxylate transporter permease n=1 Tax=Paludibacillus litoralis TaxID=3133267 RepID=UPI0030EB1476
MDALAHLLNGFSVSLQPFALGAAFGGATLGVLIGAIPGLGSVTAVALLLPLTFGMDPNIAIIMLTAVYFGCVFGGAYSAILMNIPGDTPAVMTTLDGYPMSRKGQGGKALFTANLSSFIGGAIGIVILTFLGPSLADFGLKFGPPETALLILFALSSIGWLLGEDAVKGLASTFLGVLLATVGIGMTFGTQRFSFGAMELLNGISFIPLVIGMFGFAQVLEMASGAFRAEKPAKQIGFRESLLTRKDAARILPTGIRSGFLGTFIGVLPGAGATTAAFLSYILERKIGRNRDKMGTGVIEGVAAAESGNNAAAAASFAPLLSLGIPGSGTSAVLLGGFMMWGLQPGPLLFTMQPEFVWGLVSSMYVGNFVAILAGVAIIPFLMRILWVRQQILIPIIAGVCVIAAYSVAGAMFDVWLMLGFGVLAYLMKLAKYPAAPLVLAFVLTPKLETSIRQSFDISNGSVSIFFSSSISIALLALMGLMVVGLMISVARKA